MDPSATRQLVTRFYEEALNAADMGLIGELVCADFVDHGGPGTGAAGIDAFRSFLSMVTGAFPDMHIRIEEMLCDGNKVAVRLTISGTHQGTLMGSISPTGKKAVWTGIDILEVSDGKIAARWSERNLLGLMQQLGVVRLS